jgi:GNAT superfamily N-acetyltransferase
VPADEGGRSVRNAPNSHLGGEYRIAVGWDVQSIEVIHDFLVNSYWAQGISQEVVRKSIEHSLCFGVFYQPGDASSVLQVGFARVITDYATFAYLADVFVVEAHRGRGLAQRLLRTILEHPDLRGLRRWALATRDAHGLYARFGFHPLDDPKAHMELRPADITPTRSEI